MNRSSTSALAFDVGLRRTGVAIGQSLTGSANPAGQLLVERGRHDWPAVDRLIAKWQPDVIVIGDPHTQDSALLKCINRLKHYLRQEHKLRIEEVDETLTSNEANARLAEQNLTQKLSQKPTQNLSHPNKIILRDQIAACIILESYFASISAD